MSNTIFVSYRADDEGRRYKNLLIAWSRNDNGHFDIKFRDSSIGVSVNSSDASYIRSVIKEKIRSSNTLLCLIGEDTHNSEWVDWEIEVASELGKKIVAVKIDNSYISPNTIYGKNATWARSFTYASIKKAIEG